MVLLQNTVFYDISFADDNSYAVPVPDIAVVASWDLGSPQKKKGCGKFCFALSLDVS
jgi:hypothetical protein